VPLASIGGKASPVFATKNRVNADTVVEIIAIRRKRFIRSSSNSPQLYQRDSRSAVYVWPCHCLINAVTVQVKSWQIPLSGKATNRALGLENR
jgi:hypothetical protein